MLPKLKKYTKKDCKQLLHSDKEALNILEKRLSEVKVLSRADVNVLCSWSFKTPKEIINKSMFKEFEKKVWELVEEKYGVKNVIFSYVEDENNYIYLFFVPTVIDKKRGIEKVSAFELLDRNAIINFQTDYKKMIYDTWNIKLLNKYDKDSLVKEINLLISENENLKKELEDKNAQINDLNLMLVKYENIFKTNKIVNLLAKNDLKNIK